MKDPYSGALAPTRPRQTAARAEEAFALDDSPTMVKCPTCASATIGHEPKLGCPTCAGAGFISFERYAALTARCPTCVGSGRITTEQRDALEAEAERKDLAR